MAAHPPNRNPVPWVDGEIPMDVPLEAYLPQTVGGVWLPMWWHGPEWFLGVSLPEGIKKAKPTQWRSLLSPWTDYG